MKALFSLAVLGYAGMAFAQATPGQNVVVEEKKTETVTVVVKETPKPPDFVFELHGFTSVSMYFQDAGFGVGPAGAATGQQALNVVKRYETDKPLFGGDIRQTRLNFSVRGPEILGGAIPKAVAEFDLFGGDGPGGFGDVSVFPRIRIAYTELKWKNTTIQLGQQNMLTIGMIPQSLRGIAFPMTYTAGTVGWRQPGIWGYHTFGEDTKFELAWSVQRSGWANTLLTDNFNMGVASGLPAFELRGKVSWGKLLDLWVSGHWQQEDRNGPGVIADPTKFTTLTTVLGTVGAKLDTGPFVLASTWWYGKNAAPLLGSVVQFTPTAYAGDVFGYGGWVQGGVNFTKEFSVWYTWGIDHPLYQNIIDANMSILRNINQVAMVRYQTGGFALGAEWMYSRTTWNKASAISNTQAQIDADNVLKGNQISLSFNYYF